MASSKSASSRDTAPPDRPTVDDPDSTAPEPLDRPTVDDPELPSRMAKLWMRSGLGGGVLPFLGRPEGCSV